MTVMSMIVMIRSRHSDHERVQNAGENILDDDTNEVRWQQTRPW